MPNNNYTTVLAGFTNTNFYMGPAGFMPGGPLFVASALFSYLVQPNNNDQYIVANRDVATFRGWALLGRIPPGVGGGVELFVQVGDGVSMNETSIGEYPLGMLALVHIEAVPGSARVYMQGTQVANLPGVTGIASPNAPVVGAREGGADPAFGCQLVGLAYGHNNWSAAFATLHMQNCQAAAYDMARVVQAPVGIPEADFAARFSARRGAVQPGVIPTTGALSWAPSAGPTALTRQGDGQSPGTIPLVNPSWLSLDV